MPTECRLRLSAACCATSPCPPKKNTEMGLSRWVFCNLSKSDEPATRLRSGIPSSFAVQITGIPSATTRSLVNHRLIKGLVIRLAWTIKFKFGVDRKHLSLVSIALVNNLQSLIHIHLIKWQPQQTPADAMGFSIAGQRLAHITQQRTPLAFW